LGLLAYLDSKGKGDHSMPDNAADIVKVSKVGRCETRVIGRKLDCLNPNSRLMEGRIRRKDTRSRRRVLLWLDAMVGATSRARNDTQ
jgi:hypothetical protein